jgi:hypothetical protein
MLTIILSFVFLTDTSRNKSQWRRKIRQTYRITTEVVYRTKNVFAMHLSSREHNERCHRISGQMLP